MTRVLLVDNYDSFTYNLAHQLFRVTGCPPLVHRNDDLTLAEVERLRPDVIVLSPGPGSPTVATDLGVCAPILTSLDTPVLGVCLGFQAIVAAAGGQVDRAHPVHGRTSPIDHVGRDLFAGIPARFEAVRYHSLAATAPLPASLELTAWTDDGVAMGVRHRSRAAWGVQFHPESICSQHGDRLVANFLGLATRVRPAVLSTGWSAPLRARPSSHPHGPDRAPGTLRCHHRTLPSWTEPEDAFVGLYAAAEHAFWLDSSVTGTEAARYSFLGARRPGALTLGYDVLEHRVTRDENGRTERQRAGILDVLTDELAARAQVDPDGLELPFVGGFVGYFGYEVGADCTDKTAAAARDTDRPDPPDAHWMLVDRFLAFDHHTRTAYAVAVGPEDDPTCAAWLDEVEHALSGLTPAPPSPAPPGDRGPVRLRLDREPDRYRADIAACQEAIRAGESYELCLTTQAELDPVDAPLDLYRVLRRTSPAPYAAYLRLDGVSVLCSSPERFLAVGSDRTVTSKPMKGTAARHADPVTDRRAREALRTSVKDRAENLMIVDLLRNDLGRVCDPDSVTVPVLMEVETYATVHQLVSTVSGRLPPDRGALDCVRAAFPGGSMTGAPKVRSMEILDRLEPRRRGVYSGSLGYLGLDGRAELNIVIRTAVVTAAATTVGLGGAITVLSDPEAEFDEIVLKAQGIVRAVRGWRQQTCGAGSYEVVGPRVDQHV